MAIFNNTVSNLELQFLINTTMKSLFKYISIAALLSIVLSSCEETLNITTSNLPPKMIMEGLIDDKVGADTIRLSYTTNWNDKVIRYADDATVTLNASDGYSAQLTSIGKGRYITPADFLGKELGPVYTVNINQGGKTYSASSAMPRIYKPALDSITTIFKSKESFFKEGYYVKVYARLFNDANSFYLFKFYRNDSLLNKYDKNSGAGQIYVSDNSQIASKVDGLEIPYTYRKGDLARVEVYSITRDAYNYYNDIVAQINSDGGMFGTPPANVKGNWSNDGLGFLQVSSFYSDTLRIK